MPSEIMFMVPGKEEQVRRREDMEEKSTSLREAYQSRHGSGHIYRIPSFSQTELAFVQQIHAGIQDGILKLFWGENGGIFICCPKPQFACHCKVCTWSKMYD